MAKYNLGATTSTRNNSSNLRCSGDRGRKRALGSFAKITFICLVGMFLLGVNSAFANEKTRYQQSNAEIVAAWNNLALDWIRQSERGPTISSRLSAYLNIAMYDAWATFDRYASGIVSDPARPHGINRYSKSAVRRVAMSQAAHQVLNTIGESILKQEYLEISVGEDAEARLAVLRQRSDELLEKFSYIYSSDYTEKVSNIAAPIAAAVAEAVSDYAAHDGSNQIDSYSDTSGYQPTPWAYPIPRIDDGITDYDFLDGSYSFTAFDPVAAEAITNPGYAEVHPGVADGSIRLTEAWQGLTELGVFPPADDGGQAFPLTPHWGGVSTLVLKNGHELRPESVVGPYLNTGELNPQWVEEARQLVEFAATMQDGKPGSALNRARSEYWELGDESEYPPGWWTQRASDLIVERGLNLRSALKLMLAVSLATYESSIAAWDTKFAFDTVRPISAVNELFYGSEVSDWRGEITARIDDRDHWRPYQLRRNLTPPFPDIVSGHSTFSTSAATVMTALLGSNYFGYTSDSFASRFDMTDGFDGDSGNGNEEAQLNWQFFSLSAEEAGLSRLYGGIHMMEGNILGLQMGTQIGHKTLRFVNAHFGDWGYRIPHIVFGSGVTDELSTPENECGKIEIYGYHNPDKLISDLNCYGWVRLFGGEGMDSYKIAGRGWIKLRDYEQGEVIAIAQSRLQGRKRYSRYHGSWIDGHHVKAINYKSYQSQPYTDLVVDGYSVLTLDGAWQLDELNLQFVQ